MLCFPLCLKLKKFTVILILSEHKIHLGIIREKERERGFLMSTVLVNSMEI